LFILLELEEYLRNLIISRNKKYREILILSFEKVKEINDESEKTVKKL
jgi:hypothetical protein